MSNVYKSCAYKTYGKMDDQTDGIQVDSCVPPHNFALHIL